MISFSNALRLCFRLVSPVPAQSDGKSGTPIQRWSINICQDLGGWWRSRRRRPRCSCFGPWASIRSAPATETPFPITKIRRISVEFAEDSPRKPADLPSGPMGDRRRESSPAPGRVTARPVDLAKSWPAGGL